MDSRGDGLERGVGDAVAWFTALPMDDEAELRHRAAHGVAALDEAEVLQLILARTRPRAARGLADALLARFGGAARVLGAPRVELIRVVGVDVADDLELLHALLLRALELPLRRREVLTSSAAVEAYLCARLRACPREAVHALYLDRKNQLIADERLGEGTVDHAPIYPREVVRRALELSASALLLAHNHPSGDPSPSPADVEVTKRVMAAAQALQITLHDHLIIGAHEVISLRALGLM